MHPADAAPYRMRLKRRRAHTAIYSERDRIRRRDRQTDKRTNGLQHRSVPPTVGQGRNDDDDNANDCQLV